MYIKERIHGSRKVRENSDVAMDNNNATAFLLAHQANGVEGYFLVQNNTNGNKRCQVIYNLTSSLFHNYR